MARPGSDTLKAHITVRTPADLVEAARTPNTRIDIDGVLSGLAPLTLSPGVVVRGGVLRFKTRGLTLTRDNVLGAMTIRAAPDQIAIANDLEQSDLGLLQLDDLTVTGQVLLLADGSVRTGHVNVRGLSVLEADLRNRRQRPRGFGVEAMQGAFTLWNRQSDPRVVITARLLDISAGTPDSPIRGSGVFVAGSGDEGGAVMAPLLRTGEIHTDGGIAPGTADLISGGVFVLKDAVIEEVVNDQPVTTYGANDMVLDNWGKVSVWTAKRPIESRGSSAIGFVNFGEIGLLDVRAPIETHGPGARGFNLYDGSLTHARFKSITTAGDGAVGIQVAKELPLIEVEGDVATSGGVGMSLVKGVQTLLKAAALSIQEGGRVGKVSVGGWLATSGEDVVTVELDGQLDEIEAGGGIRATGRGSDAVRLRGRGPDLGGVVIEAEHGRKGVHGH
jgi:hypothetical protein